MSNEIPKIDPEKAEREWKEAEKGTHAWHKTMQVEVPTGVAGGRATGYKTVEAPIIFMVQSARDGATNARDRIFATALLAIMEEVELFVGKPPGRTWEEPKYGGRRP